MEEDGYYKNAEQGKAQKINQIFQDSYLPYQLLFADGKTNTYSKIRFANGKEIEEYNNSYRVETIIMGFGNETFELRLLHHSKRVLHGYEDITDYVTNLVEYFIKDECTSNNDAGSVRKVIIDYDNLVFKATGCENKKTSYRQWQQIYNKIKS